MAPLLRTGLVAAQVDSATTFTLTLCRLDELALGGLTAILAQDADGRRRLAKLAPWALAVFWMRLFPPDRIAQAASPLGFTASHLLGLLGFAALGIGLTMLLAVGSHHLFERHFLKLPSTAARCRAPIDKGAHAE